MFKLLLADDEPKIRRGLRKQIESMGLPLEICGEAEDGEMAYELAVAMEPDVIIADICMPFLNGLDFVEQLQKSGCHPRIIILSGYDEFQYAQRSLRLQVREYLLKPVDTEELRRVLETILTECTTEQEKRGQYHWVQSQLEKRMDILREQFLQEWLEGKLPPADLERGLGQFAVELGRRPTLWMLVPMQQSSELSRWAPELLRYAVGNILEELMAPRPLCLFHDIHGKILALVDQETVGAQEMEQMAATLEQSLQRHFLTGCMELTEPMALPECYRQLVQQTTQQMQRSEPVQQALQYITAHLSRSDLSLPDVAGAVGVNAAYLSRLMKQELGAAFMEYLTSTRIRRAVELMLSGNTRIKEIASMVGYSNQFYFSTAFKNAMGRSPANFIREMEGR